MSQAPTLGRLERHGTHPSGRQQGPQRPADWHPPQPLEPALSQRINYIQQSPELFKKLVELNMLLKKGPIEESILALVSLRASQINGCGFCVDMHVKEARIHGERELRLHHVAIWRESTLFSPRERAALAWTEAVTLIADGQVPDSVYQEVQPHFTEKELADLTVVLATINAWNRLSISGRSTPGTYEVGG